MAKYIWKDGNENFWLRGGGGVFEQTILTGNSMEFSYNESNGGPFNPEQYADKVVMHFSGMSGEIIEEGPPKSTKSPCLTPTQNYPTH